MSKHTPEQPQEHPSTKICTKCNQELPLDAFPVASGRYGRRASCAECERKRMYISRYGAEAWDNLCARRERAELLMQQRKKICNLCRQELDFEHFTLNAANKDGRDSRCRDCSHSVYATEIASRRTPEQIKKDERLKELTDRGMKECKTCHEIKTLDHFRPKKLTCRECLNMGLREYRLPIRKEISEKGKRKYYADPVKSLFYNSRNRCKHSDREFDLSLEYLQELWKQCNGKCSLSGIAFASDNSNIAFSRSPYRPSLDRIDNTKGYVVGNVRFVLCALNISINEYGLAVYLRIAQAVVQRNVDPFAVFNFARSSYD
jgi:Zn ribbon nucleic-acid-binding protein